MLEVVAYAADEAQDSGSGQVVVSLLPDGSVAVADTGRGTDTLLDEQGRVVRKPVMASKDLRFFDSGSVVLPDGQPRRGMSVVAALSTWLVHSNRRSNGSWTQRYERGIPVTDLAALADDGTTGTTVHFRPDPALVSDVPPDPEVAQDLAASLSPNLAVQVRREPPTRLADLPAIPLALALASVLVEVKQLAELGDVLGEFDVHRRLAKKPPRTAKAEHSVGSRGRVATAHVQCVLPRPAPPKVRGGRPARPRATFD